MRKLGLDLGNRTLGIALSDELGFLASGLETFRFEEKDFKSALDYTLKVIVQYNVDSVVLGLPKNMDGSLGEQANLTKEFKLDLERESNIKVILWDERLTSRMASNMMKSQNLKRKKRKKDIDKMAAIIILQGYLDSQG
ncbi:MAG: putative Holliday junction resolvase [Candidatus Izimaplasma bacterium HR2]|nr:MAG: putative Holliday junction resolvase [Candidatus Izimaplasma bacterium HR2]